MTNFQPAAPPCPRRSQGCACACTGTCVIVPPHPTGN
jgi:hypothetical protein